MTGTRRLVRSIDRLLRREFTTGNSLRVGRIDVPVPTLVIARILLGCRQSPQLSRCSFSSFGWITTRQ